MVPGTLLVGQLLLVPLMAGRLLVSAAAEEGEVNRGAELLLRGRLLQGTEAGATGPATTACTAGHGN